MIASEEVYQSIPDRLVDFLIILLFLQQLMNTQTSPREANLSKTNINRYLYWLFLVCFPLFPTSGLIFYLWLNQPQNQLDTLWLTRLVWVKFTWFIPIFWTFLNFLGLVLGGYPSNLKLISDADWCWDKQVLLIVSYVSKGNNQKALYRSLLKTQQILDSTNTRYEIEIVTDIEVPNEARILATKGSIYYYLVPQSYETNTKVKYKARALQYRLEQRAVRFSKDDDINLQNINVWVLHLDEESIITSQAIVGIKDFIEKYSLRKSKGAIGQGEILYNSYNYGKNILITAMDSIRTGEDLGRFRFQYKFLNKPVGGIHGSYILMPARIEKAIGWDWGSKSILTEDSYFGLKAMERNIKFDWVNGFIKEQSPFSIGDIIKQRMRWYTGISLIVTDISLKFSSKIILILFVICWTLSGIIPVLFITNLIVILYTNERLFPFWMVMITSWTTGIAGSIYMIGLLRNLTYWNAPFWKKLYIGLATYILWLFQILSLVEAVAVLYAIYRVIFRPLKDFPIVDKD